MHNRALLLQQPRRNSYCICLHPTCPGVIAMSPPTAAAGNIHNSTCCEWDHSREDTTRAVDDGGEMVRPRVCVWRSMRG